MEFTAIVLDTETTGLDTDTAGLVELSAVRVEGDLAAGDAILSTEMDTLCDPGVPIPAQASAVHHLVDADLAGKPAPRGAVQDLIADLDPKRTVIVAHNIGYDRAMLAGIAPEIERAFRWACSFRMARRLYPQAPGHGNQVLRYHLGIEIPEEAENIPPHRALHDAYVTAGILTDLAPKAIAEASAADPIDALVEQTEAPIELEWIPFTKHYGTPFSELEGGLLKWLNDKRDQWSDPDLIYTIDREIERRRAPAPQSQATPASGSLPGM